MKSFCIIILICLGLTSCDYADQISSLSQRKTEPQQTRLAIAIAEHTLMQHYAGRSDACITNWISQYMNGKISVDTILPDDKK